LGGIGVDLQHFSYLETDKFSKRFVFIGRLLPEKGFVELVDAFLKLVQLDSAVQLDIIGSQDKLISSVELRKRMDICQKHANINLIGQVKDVRPWIWKGLVLVLPSYREGFPVSVQEAMACGRAVIASNVAGCRDAVRDEITGILVESHSSDALYNAMKKLILNPNLAVRMGLLGRRNAEERFDRNVVDLRLSEIILNKESYKYETKQKAFL